MNRKPDDETGEEADEHSPTQPPRARLVTLGVVDCRCFGHGSAPYSPISGGRPLARYAVSAAGSLSPAASLRSEEHTPELQSLIRKSYAVFCLKKKRSPQ